MSNGFNGSTAADLAGLPAGLGEVIAEHGQGMVALVYGVAMATEATQRLVAGVQGRTSMMHAMGVLAGVFNQTSSAYCRVMGWNEEGLQACGRDVQLALSRTVLVPEGKIILAS